MSSVRRDGPAQKGTRDVMPTITNATSVSLKYVSTTSDGKTINTWYYQDGTSWPKLTDPLVIVLSTISPE